MTGVCAEDPVSDQKDSVSSTSTRAAPGTHASRPLTDPNSANGSIPTTTTSPSTTTTTSPPDPPDTGDVSGFEIINAHLGGRFLLLAVADTPALQSRGLMGVESMGDLHGMVFVWEEARPVSFWMKNTLIPLDIGYFDQNGALIRVLSMTPCTSDPCLTYPSETPVRFALETLPGFFVDVEAGESLTLGETVASP